MLINTYISILFIKFILLLLAGVKLNKIKIAIVGIGNCASSLIQGIHYYDGKNPEDAIGLMHWDIGGYEPSDIEVVAAFDVDKRKVGKTIDEAIFAKPNCTTIFQKDIPKYDAKVSMGHVLDGVAEHMSNYDEEFTFVVSDEDPVDVVEVLKASGAEILVNYLPVGSEKAARYYAQCALDAGVAYVNCMPVFIVSDDEWDAKFREKGIPIVGDDIKAQIGATITHRTLASTEAVQSVLNERMEDRDIHIGPSDYVPWQNDNKLCFLRMEGRTFGDVPMNIELRLSVEDSPNSAGCVIDAVRCCKIGLERGIGGQLTSISSYTMKHPPIQYTDDEAYDNVEKFISGDLER